MNDYTGKICPYCKTKFMPGDDLVVCSECDMPHHKECWIENQGCTTFGCLGTIHTADQAGSSVTTTQMNYEDSSRTGSDGVVFCTKCGAQSPASASFCARCGNRLIKPPECSPQLPVSSQPNPVNRDPDAGVYQQNASYQAPNSAQGGGSQGTGIDTDVQQLIGTNTEYYLPRFQVMKSQNKSDLWNWPAFLVAPYWMIYRKMYTYGAALLAADILISLVGSAYLSLIAFCCYITFGFLGNNIYMKHIESKANQVKTMNEPYKSQFMTANGGVNTTATILVLIGRGLLVAILIS